MHHDKPMNERAIKTINTKWKKTKTTGCGDLTMTVDDVNISKIHHDKRMNE